MDRNYYIRIVLEARDNLSKIIKEAVDKGNREFAVLGTRVDRLNSQFDKLEKSVGKTSQSVDRNRNVFLKFAQGVDAARDRTSKLSDALIQSGGNWTRFGFFVRQTVRDVDRFINLRWLLVVGFLVVMGNALVVVGANLLAVAASATRAASALGGALVAGIAQLLPVLALLQLTMSRLDKVMDAVDKSEKARIASSQDAIDQARAQQDAEDQLADAKYGLLQANEAVMDAEIALKDARLAVIEAEQDHKRAVQDLAEARQQAADDIAESRLDEREAALALEEAELAVLDAKRRLREEEQRTRFTDTNIEFARQEVANAKERLRIVTEQGDQAEISSANQALNFAETNLNAILNSAEQKTDELKQKQLDVEQAEVNRDQAALRNQQAQREGVQTRKLGIEGSDVVIQALERVEDTERGILDARRAVTRQTRQLRDANHNVTIALRTLARAHREVADAATKQSAAQKAASDARGELTATERRLADRITRFKRVAEKEFGPIQDIITAAFSRAVDAGTELLLDPRIQRAATRLAKSLASVIDMFSDFSKTKEFRDALVFFTNQAARNVPKLGAAFLDLLRIFLRIGRAATPIFNDLLDRFVKLLDRIEKGTRDEGRLRRFFNAAGEHLDAWINLAKAVGNVFAAFAFDTGAADSGLTLLRDITDLLNDWADWIRDNPELINAFFEDMRLKLEALAAVFGKFGKLLFEVFRSDEASAFSELILETFVPAFEMLVKTLGIFSKIMLFVFNIPVVGTVAKWIVVFGLFYGMLNRLFAITGILGREGFTKLFKSITEQNGLVRRYARGLRDIFAPALTKAKDAALNLAAKGKVLADTLEKGVKRAAERAALEIDVLRIRAARARQALADKARAAVDAAIKIGGRFRTAIINAATSVVNFTRAMGAAAVSTMRRFASFIAIQVVNALRLLRLNIRLLIGATGIGLLILAAALIIEHWDKVKKFLNTVIDKFREFISWIRNNWKDIAKIIGLVLLGPAGAIFLIYKFRDKILAAFGAIKDGIINIFKEAFKWLQGAFNRFGDWLEKKIKSIPVLNKFLGDSPEITEAERQEAAAEVLAQAKAPKKKVARLRARGLTNEEILEELIESGDVDRATVTRLLEKALLQKLATGGQVQGSEGRPVPILAHAGEWVVNRQQQAKLARQLGMSAEQAAMWLFGTAGRGPRGGFGGQVGQAEMGRRGRDRANSIKRAQSFGDVKLVVQEDEFGIPIWFVQMADGTFGQVSARDAAKIEKSNGSWVPGYVKRSTHGFNQKLTGAVGQFRRLGGFAHGGIVPSFALGGVVPSVQAMSEGGGISLNTGSGGATPRIGEFKQHFEVKTESELDWNYVMRLGAIHAQASF